MCWANVALPPPVPIIDSVEVAVLSLFEVEVNISLLTNGGQSVTQYIVSGWLCASVYATTIVIEAWVPRWSQGNFAENADQVNEGLIRHFGNTTTAF